MRRYWLTLAALGGLVMLVPRPARAADTVFDFLAPRADQVGTYQAGPGARLQDGFGTLAPTTGWFDEDWSCRLRIAVENPTGGALVEWPLALDIDAEDPAGAALFRGAQATGADLRIVDAGGTLVDRMARGRWDLAANRGWIWFRPDDVAVGPSDLHVYFCHATASGLDDATAVFTYSAPYASQYLLDPTGADALLASLGAANGYVTGSLSGALQAGEVLVIDASDWVTGQTVAATGPFSVGFLHDAAAEGVPLALASPVHAAVISRGTDNTFILMSPFGDATVTVTVGGVATATLELTAGVALTWVNDVAANAVVRFDATRPILATQRGADLTDGYALPPPASELWGVRSGTFRILAVDVATDVVVYSSAGTTQNLVIPAGQSAALAAAGSGDGDGLHLVATDSATGAPARITAVGNGDGDGGDAIVMLPDRELSRAWVVPTAGRFVRLATTAAGATCTLQPPGGGAAVTASAADTAVPPFPGVVMFGATTGVNLLAGSVVTCDAPAFAYYEHENDDERNLHGVEAHRKVADPAPSATLQDGLETRYPAGVVAHVDTPDLVAATAFVAFTDFREALDVPPGTTVSYQVSVDGGATWLIPAGAAWAPVVDEGADASAIRGALAALDPGTGRLRVRTLLGSDDGIVRPSVDAVRVFYDAATPATRLTFDPLPDVVGSGEAIFIGLTAVNASGMVITGVSGDLALTASNGAPVVPDTIVMEGGRATATIRVMGVGESVTLTAVGPGGIVGYSLPFGLEAPLGMTLEIVSGDGQFGAAGTPLAEPLVVRVTDGQDVAIPGAAVLFAATEGGGTLDGGAASVVVMTDATGEAEAHLTLGAAFGANRVQVTAYGQTVEFLARADDPDAPIPLGGGADGCGCGATPGPAGDLPGALFWILLAALVRRRRRR
jgi:MYXO-CTERM domain-containing protein